MEHHSVFDCISISAGAFVTAVGALLIYVLSHAHTIMSIAGTVFNVLRFYIRHKRIKRADPGQYESLFEKLRIDIENEKKYIFHPNQFEMRVRARCVDFLKHIGYSGVYFWDVVSSGESRSGIVDEVFASNAKKSASSLLGISHSIGLSLSAEYVARKIKEDDNFRRAVRKIHEEILIILVKKRWSVLVKMWKILTERRRGVRSDLELDVIREKFLDLLNRPANREALLPFRIARILLHLYYTSKIKRLGILYLSKSHASASGEVSVDEVLGNKKLRREAILQLLFQFQDGAPIPLESVFGKENSIKHLLLLLRECAPELYYSEKWLLALNGFANRRPSTDSSDIAEATFRTLLGTQRIRKLPENRDVLVVRHYFNEGTIRNWFMVYLAKKKKFHELHEESILATVAITGKAIRVSNMDGKDICLKQDRLLAGIGKMASGVTSYTIFPLSRSTDRTHQANNAGDCEAIKEARNAGISRAGEEGIKAVEGVRHIAHVISRSEDDDYTEERFKYVEKLCELISEQRILD
ncbi:MAG: hypothetical protein HQL66_05705 [Magnetococcales bacterium]|nr:hypothetical protein [Magnetococcales bacterium]